MKKFSLILILFCIPALSSTDVDRTFGIFGGLSLANINYNPAEESTYRKGMNLGLDFEFPISKHIFLVPSLYVIQKGAENSTGTTRLNYFEVAFTPKFKSSTDATGLYFLLGPYVASILTRSFISTAGVENDYGDSEVKNTEGGMIGGVGFEALISHHWTVYLEGRYAMGLTRSFETVDAKNNTISINLGFHYLDREDLETNFDRAEEFVKRKSDPSNPAAGEQSIRPGNQEPFEEPSNK